MAKKPNSDLINRRLRMDGSRGSSGRTPPPADDDEESGFPFEFAAIIGAAMLTVGIGSYLWFSGASLWPGKQKDNFVSVADAACRGLWVAQAKNTPGLVCYLTTSPERLCNPQERVHLATVMQQYRLDRNAFDTNMVLGGVKAVAIMKTQTSTDNMMEMAAAFDGMAKDGKAPTAKQQAAINEHFDTVSKMEKAVSNSVLDAALKLKHIPDGELVDKIRALATAGYVGKADFGWFTDPLVEKAFTDLGPVGNPCKA